MTAIICFYVVQASKVRANVKKYQPLMTLTMNAEISAN